MRMNPVKILVGTTGPALALQELLYGFIMELIFVTAARIGILAYDDAPGLCLMILGMNATWGGIDAVVFFLIDHFNYRKYRRLIVGVREGTVDRGEAADALVRSFDATPLDTLSPEAERRICEMVLDSELETDKGMADDYRGMAMSAIGCFVITLLTVVPVVVPILAFEDTKMGLDTASVLASVLMFFIGYRMKNYTGVSGWLMGLFLTGVAWTMTIVATFSGG